jgi:acyl-CoA synthetase (AMP-forming)/AMP-acid ligase II
MEFFFALAKLGAVCVPLNWRLTPDELASILEDSGAETLIYGDAFREAATDVHSRGEDATAVRRWVHLGESVDPFSLRLGDLLASASDDEPDLAGFEDDPLFIMYTSGTTGLPKGVVHTHNTVLWAVASMAITQEMRNSDRFLVALPLFHVGALSPAIMSVYCGITAVVSSGFDPVVFWKTIEAERVTNTLMVPTILTVMLQAQEKDLCDHTALRWVAVAGAPVPISLLEAYRPLGIELQQLYGLTEACGPACLLTGEDVARKAGSAGKPFLHNEVRVVDPGGRDVGPGERGELIIQGKHVMREYWKQPEATAETLRDGWLVHHHRGPDQGHDHLGGGKRISGRDREGDLRSSRSCRRRGDRTPSSQVGGDSCRGYRAHRCGADRGRGFGVLRGQAGALQDPEGS